MRTLYILIIIFSFLITISCQNKESDQKLKNVGILLPETINDQSWNTKGYESLLGIQTEFGVDVFYKEEVKSLNTIRKTIIEFQQQDVNLVFGHGNIYAKYFVEIQNEYPFIHFVTFNGDAEGQSFTSLHFKGRAMGFFGGMIASGMSKTNKVGIIAAFPWQPEIEGFESGVKFQNNNVQVITSYTNDWANEQKALSILDEFLNEGVDVVYPAGDGYSVAVIEKLKRKGLYAVGFVTDQYNLGKATVLTSTVQHVDQLYILAARQFNNNELSYGNLYFDMQDDVISMGKYSAEVPEQLKQSVQSAIDYYVESGQLPNKEEL
ncbi:BMP family ABC transporter substrate-binding protein [Bacillus taeanensis]|uniref:BMP family ABC transporter substrate-binding protein n=1 Tax=Bacillus taeanensis TaxID=273032 RepID=A0A366XY47_9BACI|nr:BMP family ABC transporter substrate-binding protein [Bacillus taeanensis]RBW71062.1 BMP family ABC transporter substrate-binding protein [Bacillus taeanensis]